MCALVHELGLLCVSCARACVFPSPHFFFECTFFQNQKSVSVNVLYVLLPPVILFNLITHAHTCPSPSCNSINFDNTRTYTHQYWAFSSDSCPFALRAVQTMPTKSSSSNQRTRNREVKVGVRKRIYIINYYLLLFIIQRLSV